MLSAIQKFLERNRRWLFVFLLIVIVVPFVFTIGNAPGLSGGHKTKSLKVFGYNLSDRKDLQEQAVRSMQSLILQGESEDKAWQAAMSGYLFYRLWLLSLAQNLRLPEPNDEQLQAFIRTRKRFLNEQGGFQPDLYNAFLTAWTMPFLLKSLMIEDYQCEQLQSALEGVGSLLPGEAEQAYRTLKTTYDLNYWVVENKEQVPEAVRDADLQAYFQKHSEAFRVPQKADVTLLVFNNHHYRSQLPTPSDAALTTYFNQHSEAFKVNGGLPDFSSIKSKVKTAWENEQLKQLAGAAANQLATQVYEQSLTLGSAEWKQLIQSYGVQCMAIPPYAQTDNPQSSQVSKEVLSRAFDLNQEHFLSDPFPLNEGVGLLVLNKFIPSYIPDLSSVRSSVLAAIKKDKKQELFAQKIIQIKHLLTTKAKANSMNLKSIALSIEHMNFQSLSKVLTRDGLLELLNDLGRFKNDQWFGAYTGIGDSVVFFFCKNKIVPQNFAKSAEFKAFSSRLLAERKQVQSQAVAQELIAAAIN